VQRRIIHAVGPNHFTFRCTPEVKRWLLKEGTDPKYGARHLKRVIERNIVYGLANLVATGQIEGGECISVNLKPDGSLGFSKAAASTGQASAAD
jgi:ATP-dependent Clp protease ATP-binding subunit ClpA